MINKFFSDYRYMPQLQRYSPTKLCDGAKMAIFCILYFQRAACSTFQTCILNSHCHTMCGSMVDIQSLTAEIRRGKKKERRRRKKQDETRMWANAQPDGRPAEHRWRPLFNAAKFG